MRYDWNRFGKPGIARVNMVAAWALTGMAAASWPVYLWLSLAWGWTMVMVPLFLTAFAVFQQVMLRKVYGAREPSKAERTGGMREHRAEYIREEAAERLERRRAALGRRPGSAWDVSTTFDGTGYTGLWHYEDASRKPGGGADGVIRVIPRSADRSPWSPGMPVITSWTVITRAARPVEGNGLLLEAEPLLRACAAGLRDASRGARYFRVEGGRLVGTETGEVPAAVRLIPVPAKGLKPGLALRKMDSGEAAGTSLRTGLGFGAGISAELAGARLSAVFGLCAHADAEPVDLLITGERVAWVCPECGAELPAGWR